MGNSPTLPLPTPQQYYEVYSYTTIENFEHLLNKMPYA